MLLPSLGPPYHCAACRHVNECMHYRRKVRRQRVQSMWAVLIAGPVGGVVAGQFGPIAVGLVLVLVLFLGLLHGWLSAEYRRADKRAFEAFTDALDAHHGPGGTDATT